MIFNVDGRIILHMLSLVSASSSPVFCTLSEDV